MVNGAGCYACCRGRETGRLVPGFHAEDQNGCGGRVCLVQNSKASWGRHGARRRHAVHRTCEALGGLERHLKSKFKVSVDWICLVEEEVTFLKRCHVLVSPELFGRA